MPSFIKVEDVSKTFREGKSFTPALRHINMEVREGEFFVLVGPSGCGKSTLLRIISGLDKDYTGKVVFPLEMNYADISFVFQSFALLPWLTVYENVKMGVLAKKFPADLQHKSIMRQIKSLGLERFVNSYPKDLSGGMKQRVGMARALVNDPKVMFMDEPFSELDSFTAKELRQDLLRIWEERRMTIIMVTHIVQEAIELSDRIAVFTPRPGTIEQVVLNRLQRPRNIRSAASFNLEDRLYSLVKP